jgi:hypothetical protein
LVEAEAPTTNVTSVTFYRNRRRFELQCISSESDERSEMPCGAGFRELIIRDQPEIPQSGDKPRVLHLQEERYRLRFDAPDDTWLAVGPRTGGSGKQLVWIWNSAGRQADVQVLDFAGLSKNLDEAAYLEGIANSFRKPGASVTLKRSTLAGVACDHIEVRADGRHQDLFLQRRGEFFYGLLITLPTRDPRLVERLKAGLRIE